jgi:hypothetical protein
MGTDRGGRRRKNRPRNRRNAQIAECAPLDRAALIAADGEQDEDARERRIFEMIRPYLPAFRSGEIFPPQEHDIVRLRWRVLRWGIGDLILDGDYCGLALSFEGVVETPIRLPYHGETITGGEIVFVNEDGGLEFEENSGQYISASFLIDRTKSEA